MNLIYTSGVHHELKRVQSSIDGEVPQSFVTLEYFRTRCARDVDELAISARGVTYPLLLLSSDLSGPEIRCGLSRQETASIQQLFPPLVSAVRSVLKQVCWSTLDACGCPNWLVHHVLSYSKKT